MVDASDLGVLVERYGSDPAEDSQILKLIVDLVTEQSRRDDDEHSSRRYEERQPADHRCLAHTCGHNRLSRFLRGLEMPRKRQQCTALSGTKRSLASGLCPGQPELRGATMKERLRHATPSGPRYGQQEGATF